MVAAALSLYSQSRTMPLPGVSVMRTSPSIVPETLNARLYASRYGLWVKCKWIRG